MHLQSAKVFRWSNGSEHSHWQSANIFMKHWQFDEYWLNIDQIGNHVPAAEVAQNVAAVSGFTTMATAGVKSFAPAGDRTYTTPNAANHNVIYSKVRFKRSAVNERNAPPSA